MYDKTTFEANNGSNTSSSKKRVKNKLTNDKESIHNKSFDPFTSGLGPVQASLGTDFKEPDQKFSPKKK